MPKNELSLVKTIYFVEVGENSHSVECEMQVGNQGFLSVKFLVRNSKTVLQLCYMLSDTEENVGSILFTDGELEEPESIPEGYSIKISNDKKTAFVFFDSEKFGTIKIN